MYFFDKLAATKGWEDNLSPEVREEIDLIREAQKNDGFFSREAYKKLLNMYTGMISTVAKETGYNRVVSHDEAMMFGTGVFRDLIMDKNKLDLNKLQGKPSTRIYQHLKDMMRKQKPIDSMGVTYVSPELKRKVGAIELAKNNLRNELNREPNDDEVYNFIKKELKQTGVSKNNIKRISLSIKPELSGNSTVGEGDMTLFDIVSQDEISAEKMLTNSVWQKRYEETLHNGMFSFTEIDFIKRYLGLPPYASRSTINASALNSGLSGYEGEQALDRLRTELRRKYTDYGVE